ncbi:MAG: pyridoxamine 5'-phosphate oxidase family protein [Gemmatimonadetes bacterium]|nr:pyridoxamine 5'-phosphate oxidase family protein [Gemmatimonadota bacterium]
MPKPEPKHIDPAEVRELAAALVRSARFPTLATMDGDQPRVRPVSPVRTDEFTIYVANLKSYHKTGEIQINNRVELAYVNEDHDQVRITGTAEVVQDRELIEDIFRKTPLLRHYLGSPDNPELIIYRIVPTHVRYMQEWALEYYEVPLGA